MSHAVEQLLADQHERWHSGERILVESYLERYPELRDSPEAVLDLIYHEIFLRERHGTPPRLQEYLGRFPHFAEQLRLQFEVHQLLRPQDLPVPDSAGGKRTGTGQRPAGAPPPAIPGYEVLEELGRGSMGVVYKARQVALNRLVALKLILGTGRLGARQLARFRVEAEAVARLQHPNVVQIFEVGEYRGVPYCALELAEGGSLARRLAGRPQEARGAAHLTETLARAMHVAHQHGIIHRDLKPANVLLAIPSPPHPPSPTKGRGGSQTASSPPSPLRGRGGPRQGVRGLPG